MQIDGLSALVTGGGSGLGAATARGFAQAGAHVAVLDFDAAKAEAVAKEIEGLAIPVDVGDAAAIGAALDRCAADLRHPLRIAVNCAGIAPAARMAGRDGAVSTDLFAQVIRVNLLGTFNVMAHATRVMQSLAPTEGGERGVIINTASIAYQDGQFGQTAYAASKGGVAAMALPAARELAKTGIRVVAIAPGLFHTPMMEGLPEDVTAGITANIPFPDRLGDPAEYALLVRQIVENPYLNGTTLRLDAATRLPPR